MQPLSNRPKRILNDEEWETLRPVIQLHYIDENKTFTEVARILKEKDGFEPT
jgi:Clr5 domain